MDSFGGFVVGLNTTDFCDVFDGVGDGDRESSTITSGFLKNSSAGNDEDGGVAGSNGACTG